jgi:hypothetical protein
VRVVFAVLLVIVLTGSVQAQDSVGDRATRLWKPNVVKINATLKKGATPQEGFGFIVGRLGDKLIVVTANHVVRDEDDPDAEDKAPLITFFQDQGSPVHGQLLTTNLSRAEGDLAMIKVTGPAGLTFSLGPQTDVEVKRGQQVWLIGRNGKWDPNVTPGSVSGVQFGKIHIENLGARPGSSGGPLLVQEGIIGMLVTDSQSGTTANPIRDIKRQVEDWGYPWQLTQTAPTSPSPKDLAAALSDVPRIAGVTLCSDFNFGGLCKTFTADHGDLTDSGFFSIASSIRVSPGMTASLYSGVLFRGRCQTFTSDNPDLRGSGISNKSTRSIRVGSPCPSPVAAYTQETGLSTKHVAYIATDGHVHDLSVPVGGTWTDADLTQRASAALPTNDSPLAAYAWEAGRSKQVAYIASDGHIHELFGVGLGAWSDADLTKLASAPPPRKTSPIAAYAWEIGQSKQVVYIADDGDIHELFVVVGGGWGHMDLTNLARMTGATPPREHSPLAAYAWEKGSTKQVAYLADDGHIHELSVSVGGTWAHADLSQVSHAPAPDFNSPLIGYEWATGNSKQVAYVADGRIHEMAVPTGGSWADSILTDVNVNSPAPPPTFDTPIAGFGWRAGGTKQVFYFTSDTFIHELVKSVENPWSPLDLRRTTVGAAAAAFNSAIKGFAWAGNGAGQVVYFSQDGHIWELFRPVTGYWGLADLTGIARAPRIQGYP